jgi:hypothetical protein
MFTAITVTRTFLRLLVGRGLPMNEWLFNVAPSPTQRPAPPTSQTTEERPTMDHLASRRNLWYLISIIVILPVSSRCWCSV